MSVVPRISDVTRRHDRRGSSLWESWVNTRWLSIASNDLESEIKIIIKQTKYSKF